MLHLIRPAARERAELDWSEEAWAIARQKERQMERWRRQRRICERLAIAISFPLAYLAITGVGIQSVGARVIVGLWGLTLLAILACSTAIAHADGRIAGLPPRAGRRRLYPIE